MCGIENNLRKKSLCIMKIFQSPTEEVCRVAHQQCKATAMTECCLQSPQISAIVESVATGSLKFFACYWRQKFLSQN
jgi:hypothetical protein